MEKVSKFAYISLILSFGFLSLGFFIASANADEPKAAVSSRLALWDDVNLDFRKYYAKAISEKRKKQGPVILCSGGDIILFRDNSRLAVNVVSEKFHFFKTVAHVPLTAFVLLDNHCEELLTEPILSELCAFKQKYNLAAEAFRDWKLDQKTLETQQSMIDDTNSFIDRVLAQKKVSRKMLDAFALSTKDRIYKNADDAVFYELGKTDNQIALWKKSMSQDEWDKLKVIVVSPHMPRNQNRQMIYFQSLLGEKEEGHRIIYMDGEPEQEEKALNLLSVHELDREIAIAFFKDPWRMHRDLLGDAGKKFVKMHKPGSGGINLDI